MNDIAIFGAGGFGREVACLIQQINECIDLPEERWNLVGFFADNGEIGTKNEYGALLGGREELNRWPTPLGLVIAIGRPAAIKAVAESINNPNVYFPNLVAPDVTFYDANRVRMGKGNIVCSHCLVSCEVNIGNFNIFNDYTTIGHDATIGNYNALMPAVRVSGAVSMGDCNYCGVNSVILQGITIGNDTTLGAGSLIFRKTKNGHTYIGNPAYLLT